MFPQATEVIMRFLSHLGSTACMLTLLAVVAASPIVAQTRLPLRDYGYDRRYDYDRNYYRERGYYPPDGYYAYRYRDYRRCWVERRYDPYWDRSVRVRVCN